MKPLRSPLRLLDDHLSRRIDRAPSRPLAIAVPWLTVMAGSLVPALPFIASAPLMMPLGFMLFLAWRQVRPGLLPVWSGLPLGLFDDIYSGQPIGSGIVLFSLAAIAGDMIDVRVPWRGFVLDWLVASAALLLFLLLGLQFANWAGGDTTPFAVLPQFLFSALLYPLANRFVASCDRFRLLPLARAR